MTKSPSSGGTIAPPLYDELYAGWPRVSTRARVNTVKRGCQAVAEFLWLSPATVVRHSQLPLPLAEGEHV